MAGNAQEASAVAAFRIKSRNDEVLRQVQRSLDVAQTPYTVLIEGETGTGKEVFARGIHAASGRPGPFVPINCSAVPENMFEAELFGARRGAYTGLDRDRLGLFRLADGGTLFLDEVGDLAPGVQAKLLRVLEDGQIRPLGASEAVRVDVRVVAATLRSLSALVEGGAFRRDLFFRLSQVHIRLPPLRERTEDLPELIEEGVREACALQGGPPRRIAVDALQELLDYEWPGNIRELKNVTAAAVMAATGELIEREDLPPRVLHQEPESGSTISVSSEAPFFEALEEFERAYLRGLLSRAGGNISEAARQSGLSRTSVRDKARRYALLGDTDEETGPRERVRFPTHR